MSTETITADPSQYVTDPGEAHGFTVEHALSVWRAFRKLPASEQIVYRNSEEFRIMVAYMDPAETFEEFTGQQLGKIFAEHCIPSLILSTPRPDWATDTDNGFQDASEANCSHNRDVYTGDTPIHAGIQRFDTYNVETTGSNLRIGTPFVSLELETKCDEYTADDLRKIAAAIVKAADELEAVQQAS